MKRLIFILALVFAIVGTAVGQTATFNILPRNTEKTVNTDYTLTNTTESWFLWNAERDFPATQDYEVNMDSLAGNLTNVAVAFYGRKFSDDSWTQIGSTVNWTRTSSDTTILISNTTVNRYRQYKFGLTGTGTGTVTIDWQKFKIWNE